MEKNIKNETKVNKKDSLELKLRPEYIKKLEKIRKDGYTKFNSIKELKKVIEG